MTLAVRAWLVALVACGPAATTVPPTPPPTVPAAAAPPGLEIHGHRGARGRFPENTIEGHLAALPDVTVLETDLLLTKDGAVVLHHDTVLNPDTTRDERGQWLGQPGPAIRTLTLDELARYDVGRLRPGSAYAARFPEQQGRDGVRIPTLADTLVAVDRATSERARWNVEIKVDAEHPERTAPTAVAVEAVIGVLRERGALGRVIALGVDGVISDYPDRVPRGN